MPEAPTAYVAVGSNIDPAENLARALRLLSQRVTVTGVSTVYRTAPLAGRAEQDDYLNTVWSLETSSPPRCLKISMLRPIEAELGRVRTPDKYAPRPIDLDLVLYGRVVLDEPDLQLPDPDIRTRAFLAAGLAELDPALTMPDDGTRIADLFAPQAFADLKPETAITETLRRSLSHE